MTYERMAGSLGSLLLLWAAIERAAQAEIVRANGLLPKQARGIAATLRTWQAIVSDMPANAPLRTLLAETLCERLQQPLGVRNGLCHGLIGISSANGANPGSLVWQLNGVEHHIGWQQLQDLFTWLSRVPDAIAVISKPGSQNPCDRRLDNVENREWWRAEFGIRLP
ncbi:MULTISPECIES: hypothetical protein [unclassified Sphingomonas]|uniref:hypothetical protein n=1 Tax=unclassified Sphingomonas TaxID=196159 RepID=UPI0012E10D7F|nr:MULTISPECIES: hypothetical protein [unclassified Sphingomonas]